MYNSDMINRKSYDNKIFRGMIGFTLAEVLITLGIIGVVAAMTLPMLIQNYQMRVFETKLKKQYSLIQNELDYLFVEDSIKDCNISLKHNNGNAYYHTSNVQCDIVKDDLISKFKLTKMDNAVAYKGRDEIINEGGSTLNDIAEYNLFVLKSNTYITNDGSYIMFALPNIAIDVNGSKNPNKWGYDVFYFTLTANNSVQKLLLTDEFMSLAEKGGKYPRTILNNLNVNKNMSNYKEKWYWK